MKNKLPKYLKLPLVAIILLIIGFVIYGSISLGRLNLSTDLNPARERGDVTLNIVIPSPTYIEISGIRQTALDVFIEKNSFNPKERKIIARSEVNFVNFDKIPHRIVADDESFDTGRIAGGRSKKIAFLKPGIYTYHCQVHPEMKGSITVDPSQP